MDTVGFVGPEQHAGLQVEFPATHFGDRLGFIEQCLVADQGRFHRFALVHVLCGSSHANRTSVLVKPRFRPHAKPAVASVLGAKLYLDVQRAQASHRVLVGLAAEGYKIRMQ